MPTNGDNFCGCRYVTRYRSSHLRAKFGLGRYSMKKALVISAAAFIALGAAVSSSTKTNAEDNASGVAHIIQPAPVPPSAAPPEQAYYYRPYYRRHNYHRRYY